MGGEGRGGEREEGKGAEGTGRKGSGHPKFLPGSLPMHTTQVNSLQSSKSTRRKVQH